jgi:hypothetical protein
LTGLPAPGGKVPERPALAVKVENLPAARPQYGLAQADVVYEEPVEGGITRFIAIYQCAGATRIEPIRSGRLLDPLIVMQYGQHPLFAYAGAIQWVVNEVDSSSLIDVGIDHGSGYWRDPNRYAPHNLVDDSANLWASGVALHAPSTAPSPVFQYGKLPHGARPAASIHIGYQVSGVIWTWMPKVGVWARSYTDTGPATLADGGQIMTPNVVVMRAVMFATPYVEDITGSHENSLVLTGSGPLQVFRNGTVINGSWKRSNLSQTTQLLDAKGHQIPLAPGQTWVELVPTILGVTTVP